MLVRKFEQQVLEHPQNIAVKTADIQLTYKQLNNYANGVAYEIISKAHKYLTDKSMTNIALLFEHGIDMIVGTLGALKTGNIYIPFDPAYPEKRLGYMLKDSEAKVILTNSKNIDLAMRLSSESDASVIVLNIDDIDCSKNKSNLNINIDENDIAYILYTSGSTGIPKGVFQSHKNIFHFIKCYSKTMCISSKDKMTLFSAFSHDAAVMDIYSSLLNGATLYPLNIKDQGKFDELSSWMKEEEITIWHSVPTLYRYFINALKEKESFPSLRFIVLGGEIVIGHDVEMFKKIFPNTKFVNLYGQTESSFNSAQIFTADSKSNKITLGVPVEETELLVVNENNEEVSVLEEGEIVILSDYIACGYWKDEEKTRSVFQYSDEIGKLYWTGDLGLLLPDGTIQFVGRKGSVVKIRGYRVDIGEVESQLLKYEAIKEAVVLAKKDENESDDFLCAYIVTEEKIEIGVLKSYLSEFLPEYMIPTYFTQLETMPLTPNGKLNRKALAELEYNMVSGATYEAPRNEIEERLVTIWNEILQVDKVGINDNFFELGGHSLKATMLASRCCNEFGVEIHLREILKNPTIKGIGEYISSSGAAFVNYIEPVGERDHYQVSSSQRRMFILNQLNPDNTNYNMPMVFRVEGKLNIDRVEKAMHALIQRHESLRTSFHIEDEEIIQRIDAVPKINIKYSQAKGKNTDEIIQALIRPFNLAVSPLVRLEVVELSEDNYLLMFDIHHIISDGISSGLLIYEFAKLYNNEKIEDLSIQYKDYAEWQNTLLKSKEMRTQEEYWVNKFSGEIPVLNLRCDFTRPIIQSFDGDSIKFLLDKEITNKLQKIAAKTGSTMYMILLSALNILLSKYSGQEDIIVGSPIAGRNHAGLEKIIGIFVNTLAMRNYPIGNKRYEDFLKDVKKNALEAYGNQDYQFEELVDRLKLQRDISRNPLFDVMFNMQNMDRKKMKLNGLEFKNYERNKKISKFDLSFIAYETGEEILMEIEYCTKLFKKATIESMKEHFTNILIAICENIDIELREINLLSQAEENKLINEFNNTYSDYEKEQAIQELFEAQVEKTPNSIAVICEDEKITYYELNRRANSLARKLRSMGVIRDSIIGIQVKRSIEMLVGILAVLKAGGAYLPIDPEYPEDRVSYMLSDSKAEILLVRGKLKKKLDFNGWIIDLLEEENYSETYDNLEKINSSKDLAYVIYTSGSTGRPKAVMIEHKQVNNFMEGIVKATNLSLYESILCITTISFDIFVLETLVPLSKGLRIVIANEKEQIDGEKLGETIIKNNIKIIQSTPSRVQLLMESHRFKESLTSLKMLMVGGDLLPISLLRQLQQYENLKVFNMYGPTETTVWSTVKDLSTSEEVNIGKPIQNTKIFIMDKQDKIQPIGVVGEIYIAGEGVARGYLNREGLTKERFVNNPFAPGERMYRTGDLGSWLSDGNINILGRIDNQVKVRGFRIELEEIEKNLLGHVSVKEAVVIDKEDGNGIKYLCAYIVADKEITAKELRDYLINNIPDYMVPSYFMQLDKMPLTPNGKADRKALREIDGSMISGVDYEAPRNEIEKKLVSIWSEILQVEKISINDNFFQLGGHSLKATFLVSKIHKEFKVEVPLGELFKSPTIKEISEHIKSLEKNVFKDIDKAEEKVYYEASLVQNRMYMLQQMDLQSVGYNMPGAMEIQGDLDLIRLEEAVKKIIRRHDSLRTFFNIVEGKLVQVINKEADFKIEYIESLNSDLKGIIEEFIRPFDLGAAPLLRMCTIRLERNKYVLLFDMHHIISDGLSISIMANEIFRLYAGETLDELRLQYKDYSEWQRVLIKSGRLQRQEKYWINKFSDEIPILNMPTDFERPAIKGFDGDSVSVRLKDELVKALKELVRETGSTMYIVMLSALNILLSKYSGQEDIIIGSPSSGRTHAELENIIGMFVNTLAMRNNPVKDKSFKEFLKEVKENSLKAFENQDYEFRELLDKLNLRRDFSRNPLFDVMFVMQNMEVSRNELNGLTFNLYPFKHNVAKLDLTFTVKEASSDILIVTQYDISLFKRETIERMMEHLINILNQMVTNPNMKLSAIDMLSPEERNKLLYEFNNTNFDYPKDKPIHKLFEEQARKTPENIALVFNKEKLTYRELNIKSNKLAKNLREKGLKKDSIVALIVEPSLEMIIGILGILKAGGAYLPVSHEYPEDRIRYILDDSKANITLTQSKFSELVPFNGEIVDLDDENAYVGDGEELSSINSLSDLAYVIYTSGTTGKPKGVMVEHKNLLAYVNAFLHEYKLSEKDNVLQQANYSFDAFVEEIYPALTVGGKIFIVNKYDALNISFLQEFIYKNKINLISCSPLFMNELNKCHNLESVHTFISGGDVLKKEYFNNLIKYSKVYNTCGPTETTVCFSYYRCLEQINGNIPIGKPIANYQVYILDSSGNLASVGVVGEIYVSGEGVARGYLNSPELTVQRFVVNPFKIGERMYKTGDLGRWLPDGNIEFLGRADHQVKIRGFRIEIGEIEDQLLSCEGIKEAVVLDKDDNNGGKFLCAYIASDKELTAKELRESLSKNLPEYMIPSHFILLEKIPQTSNGKVDRRALLEFDANIVTGAEYEAPRNEAEEKIADIWSEVLGVERVGINDNFFDLGGHSLKATTLIGKLHKQFNVKIPLREVFISPTIKGISSYIQKTEKSIYNSIKAIKEKEYYEASSAQKRMYMLQQFDINSTVYNMPAVLEVGGKVDFERLQYAINALRERHEALRTYFEMTEMGIVQRISKETNFKIEYIQDIEETKDEVLAAKQLRTCREESIDQIIKNFVRAFDLSKAPLLRVGLIKVEAEKHILMFDIHHIISDGVSMGILISEFVKLYQGKQLRELKLQYKDYSHWQNNLLKSDDMKKQEEYWLNRFSGEIPVLNLRADYQRPSIKIFEGDKIGFVLDKELTKRLNKLIRETGSTMYMLILSVINILLSKYTGQEDIVVGSPIAGRPHTDLEGIIGIFLNTLAMRNEPEGEKTYEEFLKEVKENALIAYENQDYPFEELVDKLQVTRDMSRNPLFDVMFVLQNAGIEAVNIQEGTFKLHKSENKTAKFDLLITAAPMREELALSIEYSTRLFKKETIERMAKYLVNIFNIIAHDRKIYLKDIELQGGEEKHKLLHEFNNTYAEYPKEKTIYELFEEQAEKTPTNISVICGNERLTYEELNQKANSLARTLRAKGVGADDIVGIMAERSIEMMAGIMAILKAGGAYLPIDPDYPEDRVKYMLKDSKAKLLLTQKHLMEKISFEGEMVDLLDTNVYSENKSNLEKVSTSENLAYIIYTSGSSGRPKGVMIEHHSVINRINWMQKSYKLQSDDVILQKTPFTFDVSVWELFWWSFYGASVCLLKPRGEKDPEVIMEAIEKNKITTIHFVPSMLSAFLEFVRADKDIRKLSSIRRVFSSGEAINSYQVEMFSEKLGKTNNSKLINLYGPTEATVDVSYFNCDEGYKSGNIPIGKPIDNIQLYVVDKNYKMQPVGIPGELCIAGVGLARGYLNNAELTAEKFVENPYTKGSSIYRTGDLARWLPDGNIEFLGRIDHQVKIRGFRIELGEVESNILSCSGVKEAVVIDREDDGGNKYLCAYLVADNKIEASEIKQHLLKQLPEYMIPAYFMQLDSMPLTSNGKLDRKALPKPEGSINRNSEYEAPRNEIEYKICRVWQEVLGLEKVGINDNFFNIGGDSIKAVRAISRSEGKYSLVDLYNNSTIKKLSDLKGISNNSLLVKLTNTNNIKSEDVVSLVCIPYGGGSAIVFKNLADSLSKIPDRFTLYSINLPGHDISKPSDEYKNIKAIAKLCVEEIKITVKPPIVLYGHCVGSALTIEIARLLEQEKIPVELVYMGGVFPPKFGMLTDKSRALDPWRAYSDEHIRDFLNSIGGFKQAMELEELKFIMECFRNDVKLSQEYFYNNYKEKIDNKISAPIYSIVGGRDPLTKGYDKKYKKWSNFSKNEVKLYVIPEGDHYFTKNNSDELADIITKTIKF